jgi:HEAT repeat protein
MTRDAELVLPVLEREFENNGDSVCDLICLMGPAAAPLLPRIMRALADDDSYDLQWAAADALGAVASPDREVVVALEHALNHPSGIVRGAAARALGNTGAVAVPLLLKHLAPPFSPSAAYVADALSRMGPAAISAVDALRTAHRQGEWGLRAWAAIALARIAADPEAVPDLLKIVESDEDNGPTQQAIEALAAVGPAAKKALPALRSLRDHWNEEIVAAAEAAVASITSRAS